MAGGEGTRLRPLTCDIPKPMVPILNKPVMEYTIKLLKKYKINDIAVTMAYLPSVITDYFGTGEDWGVRLNYFTEEVPLGTGGSVKNAEEFLDNTFIVISGDALTDLDILKVVEFHKAKNSKATLVLKKESIPLEYGVIITDENERIIRFLEKPSWGEVFSDTINTGIYILEPEVLGYYKKGENFDFSKDLFPKLLRDGVPMYGYVTGDYWSDIGDLSSYTQAQFDILDGKVELEIESRQQEEGIWVDEGVKIGGKVKIEPPVFIGKNCIIKNSCNVHPYTIIGENCEIDEKSSLKRSILWKNVRLGKNCQLRGTVVCSDVSIKNKVNLFENSVVGKGSVLSSGVTVKPDIKVWPNKKIEEGTVLNQNLIWGTKGSKTLFGYKDISGDINIDITPEFASRLGSAFATIMKEDATIVVSSDDYGASRLIKNSLVCGILSTGVGVIDIRDAVMSMNRFAVTHYKADGGIHVRMDYSEPNRVHIEFSDHNGANINRSMERKIENLFNRDDYERCNYDQVKSTVEIDNFAPVYFKKGTEILANKSQIKRESPKVVVSSRSKTVIGLASRFLEHIGCRVYCDYSVFKYNSVEQYLSCLAGQVAGSDAEMGIIMGENGENLILVDEEGRTIKGEKYIALISLILLKMGKGNNLVVPYTAPQIIVKMAEQYGVKVVRTKSSPSCIMSEMLGYGERDQSLYLQYILNFDAIWGAGKIIDFLVESGTTLSELAGEIPDFHYIKEEIKCDWKDKGRIIRQIIAENKDKNIELFEGVKINDDKGWALMLPDSERPVFNIYTEGRSEEFAQELSVFFSEKVKNLLKNQRQ